MKKPGKLVVTLAGVPWLVGCFSVMQVPVPLTAPEREATKLEGVVVTDGTTEETIRFAELHEAQWTPSALSIVADVDDGDGSQTMTRLIPITQLSGLLVRQLDPGRTSAVIGGVVVGAVAVIAFLVTGQADKYRR